MENLLKRYPELETVREGILQARRAIIDTYESKGKLLLCGNGGSAADCDHIVGELMKSFKCKRPLDPDFAEKLSSCGEEGIALAKTLEVGLPAISLCSHSALSTAYANDRDPYMVFAQQLSALGDRGDLLIALTTSGNSKNCLYAAITAKAMGIKVISITGEAGGRIAELSDNCIKLPARETYLVQELTLPIYHYLCAETEKHFFLK